MVVTEPLDECGDPLDLDPLVDEERRSHIQPAQHARPRTRRAARRGGRPRSGCSRSSARSRCFSAPRKSWSTAPRCIMTRRSPRLAACCIECVTISVVSWSRATISSLSRMTWSALLGSSAAVCSSSSSSFGLQPGRHQQRQRLALAAREAADRVVEAILEAHVQAAHAIARARRAPTGSSAQPRPRGRPRRAASARFSAIDIDGAVPLNGF